MSQPKLDFGAFYPSLDYYQQHMYEEKEDRNYTCMYFRAYILQVKFIYSEKVTKFCEIFPFLLTAVLHTVKSKEKISQNLWLFQNTRSLLLSISKDKIFSLKFIYSEKTTKYCKISTVDFYYVVPVKSKGKISQNFVTFSEYMNFMRK